MGDFKNLTNAVTKDLAMLLYLDNNSNKKGNPNENFARELLELFTLGEGNYKEEDIKEAARAFTGYRVNKKKMALIKRRKLHDYGEKKFLGKSGYFDADDIVNIIFEQKQSAYFITQKLYEEFIGKKLDQAFISKIANNFYENDFDIKKLMYELLTSSNFWSSKKMIKSPIELMVSTVKNLDIELTNKRAMFLVNYGKKLNQNIFFMPDVNGWSNDWLDSNSYIIRREFLQKVVKRTVKNYNSLEVNNKEEFAKYFYFEPQDKLVQFKNKKREIFELLSNPVYQLK